MTRWPSVARRRRLFEAAMRTGPAAGDAALRELATTVEALASVRRCAVWRCAETPDAPLLQIHPAHRVLPAPPIEIVSRLMHTTFLRDVDAVDPELARALRGWTLVAPLRADGRLLGLVAVGERRDLRLTRHGDLELFEAAATAAAAGLERCRLVRALGRLERQVAALAPLAALATQAEAIGQEVRSALLTVQAMLASTDDRKDAGTLRTVSERHLGAALERCERLCTLVSAVAPPAFDEPPDDAPPIDAPTPAGPDRDAHRPIGDDGGSDGAIDGGDDGVNDCAGDAGDGDGDRGPVREADREHDRLSVG